MSDENIMQLNKFTEANRLRDAGGPVIIFDAAVRYDRTGHAPVHGRLKILIATDTYGYGKITIDGDLFDPEQLHTEFKPQWQTYTADGNDLIVSGTSVVLGHRYTVRITPV